MKCQFSPRDKKNEVIKEKSDWFLQFEVADNGKQCTYDDDGPGPEKTLAMMRMRIAMMVMTRIGGVVTPKVNPPPRQAGKGKMIILIVIITIPIKIMGWYFDDS